MNSCKQILFLQIDCNGISHNCKCEIGDSHSGVAECKSSGMSPVFLSE